MSMRGERLSQSLADEVLELIYRPRLARELTHALDHMHAVSQAHLLMLLDAGLVNRNSAAVVANEMLALEDAGQTALPNDPGLEDLYFNYETALTRRLGPVLGGSLHIGRSRNDIGATTDRMRARLEVLGLLDQLNAVRRCLLDGAGRHADVIMPGYTHMQPSQPVTFGFYLLGPASAFAREVERLQGELRRMDQSPLGAAAMAGTSFPIDRDVTAGLLGFSSPAEHSQDAVASRDWMVALASINASVAVLWSRIAQDFYIWSTMEFGLIEFADSLAGVSSIMPQKKNPVVLEVLKANAGEVIGDLTAVLSTMRASHFTHSIDATRASLNRAWSSFETSRASLTLLALAIRSVAPRAERMAQLSRSNFSTMTDLAELLTQSFGLSFRDGHHAVGSIVRTALADRISSDEITPGMVSEALGKLDGEAPAIDEQWLAGALAPAGSLARRRSAGSPAGDNVRAMLERLTADLDRDEAAIAEARNAVQASRAALRQQVEKLASTAGSTARNGEVSPGEMIAAKA